MLATAPRCPCGCPSMREITCFAKRLEVARKTAMTPFWNCARWNRMRKALEHPEAGTAAARSPLSPGHLQHLQKITSPASSRSPPVQRQGYPLPGSSARISESHSIGTFRRSSSANEKFWVQSCELRRSGLATSPTTRRHAESVEFIARSQNDRGGSHPALVRHHRQAAACNGPIE